MRRLPYVTFVALVVVPFVALADNDAAQEPAKRKPAGSKPALAITADQEVAAVALVQKHHVDLFEVLIYLKEGLPQEYDRAIRDLSRASDRLAQFEKRDPKRYRIELKLWQAQSRRQLLTARLQMGHDESLLTELRETLIEEQDLAIAVLRHERERLAARIAKIDEQIKAQEAGGEASVERKFAALTKATANSRQNANGKSRKPGARKNTKDPT